jgi:membrane protease YdiL (CAAX protease family)
VEGEGHSVRNVPWKALDAILVFVLAWIGLPLLMIFTLRELAPYVPLFSHLLTSFRNGDIIASFVFSVADALLGLGLIWLYLKHYHVTWSTVGWRKFNVVRTIAYFIVAFLAFAVLVQIAFIVVQWLFPHFNAMQEQSNDFTTASTPATQRLALLALVIIPPIVEETVFRGFIFPAFSKRLGVVLGALASSALFGLAHLQYNVSVYTIVLGLILCFMYVRLRSIWPGVALHMLNNYIAFMAIMHK